MTTPVVGNQELVLGLAGEHGSRNKHPKLRRAQTQHPTPHTTPHSTPHKNVSRGEAKGGYEHVQARHRVWATCLEHGERRCTIAPRAHVGGGGGHPFLGRCSSGSSTSHPSRAQFTMVIDDNHTRVPRISRLEVAKALVPGVEGIQVSGFGDTSLLLCGEKCASSGCY